MVTDPLPGCSYVSMSSEIRVFVTNGACDLDHVFNTEFGPGTFHGKFIPFAVGNRPDGD